MFETVDEIKSRDKNKKINVIGCIKLKKIYLSGLIETKNRLLFEGICGEKFCLEIRKNLGAGCQNNITYH